MVSSQELERHIENLQKNHRHELGIERARHKETKAQLKDLSDKHDYVATQLKVCVNHCQFPRLFSHSHLQLRVELFSTMKKDTSCWVAGEREGVGCEEYLQHESRATAAQTQFSIDLDSVNSSADQPHSGRTAAQKL